MAGENRNQWIVAWREKADVSVVDPDFITLQQNSKDQRREQSPSRINRLARQCDEDEMCEATDRDQHQPWWQPKLVTKKGLDLSKQGYRV